METVNDQELKGVVRTLGFYSILTKDNTFVNKWQDKGNGFSGGKLWEGKYIGENNGG